MRANLKQLMAGGGLEGDKEDGDDSDVEAESQMASCGPTSGACGM